MVMHLLTAVAGLLLVLGLWFFATLFTGSAEDNDFEYDGTQQRYGCNACPHVTVCAVTPATHETLAGRGLMDG